MREAHLRDLIAVVEAGSVRAAARRLGLSESAISKNLSALERSVGAPLLIRSSQGAEPTEHGKLVLRHARVIDAEMRKLDEELQGLSGKRAGNIAIGVSSTAEALLLPRAILKFREAAPQATVTVVSGPPATTVGALREGKVDFVIGPAPDGVIGPDVQAERLISTDLIVVARREHPLARSSDMRELARCDWVLGARNTAIEHTLVAALAAQGIAPPAFPVQRDSFNALLQLLLQTDFLAVVSEPAVEPFCRLGMLAVVPAPLKFEPMLQHMIVSMLRPLSSTAALLADEFRRASRAYRR